MEQDIIQKINQQGERLEEIWQSVEKTRKYFLWTLIIAVLAIVLPLVGLIFAIPQFLGIYGGMMNF